MANVEVYTDEDQKLSEEEFYDKFNEVKPKTFEPAKKDEDEDEEPPVYTEADMKLSKEAFKAKFDIDKPEEFEQEEDVIYTEEDKKLSSEAFKAKFNIDKPDFEEELDEDVKPETVSKYIKKKYADKFKDITDFENQFTQHELTANEYKKLKPEYDNLKAASTLFEDKELLKIHAFVKESGIKDYNFALQIMTADLKKLDAFDILVMKKKLDNPDVDIDKYKQTLKIKYNLSKPEGEKWDDLEDDKKQEIQERIIINESNLDDAKTSAIKEITSKRESIKLPEFQPVVDTKKLEKIEKDWMPQVENLQKTVKTVKYKDVLGKDVVIDIPAEKLLEVNKMARVVVAQDIIKNELEMTPENQTRAKELFERVVKSETYDIAMQKAESVGYAKAYKKLTGKVYNNNKTPQGHITPSTKPKVLTDEEKWDKKYLQTI